MFLESRYFGFIISKIMDNGFTLSIGIRFHKHLINNPPIHFHFLIELGWWYLEIRIGKEK